MTKSSKSPSAAKTLKVSQIKTVSPSSKRKGVQDFGDLVPESVAHQLLEYAGTSIYIVKLEQKFSNNYGDGYIVHFKDFPNSTEIMTAGCYGSVPAKQLDALFQATNGGSRISLDSPIGARIVEVPTTKGMSYKFAPLNTGN